jgi:hypothetical protein
VLTPEQQLKYEEIRQTTIADLEDIDHQIEFELTTVKQRLLDLQEAKKSVQMILDGASARLGATPEGVLKNLTASPLSPQGDLVNS